MKRPLYLLAVLCMGVTTLLVGVFVLLPVMAWDWARSWYPQREGS